ncbi:hypothetical protein Ctob_003206, partial [Chrysochromulina tobinii]
MAATPAAQAVRDLIAHARAAGAELHEAVVVKEGQRGRGLFAAAPIANGALLLSVPLSHAVVPAGPLADLVPTRCSRLLALALTVLHEIHVKSPRDPFFEMLAVSPLPATPSLWTHDAIAELEGTAAGDDYLPPHTRVRSLFAQCLAWVTSRALFGRVNYEQGAASLWPYLRADGPPTANSLILLPLFDLLNTASAGDAICASLRRVDSPTAVVEVRATRAIAATDEILITYGQHDAAELLRTYGISEGEHAQPAVTLDFRIDEVVDATRTSLAKAGAVLSAANATARCEMLRGTLVPTEPTSELANEPATTIPLSLLTLVQVLVMGDEEVREWEAAGRIMLGLPYLDAESLALVIGALLTLCNGRVRRLPKMATAPLQTEGHAEEGAVVGAGSGRSAGSSYDAVEMARMQGDAGRCREVQGDTGRYMEMARALVRRERGLLEGAFTRAVLQLECDGSK